MELNTAQKTVVMENSQIKQRLLEIKEFYIIHKDIIHKILVGKTTKSIIIKSKNYSFSFNKSDSPLINSSFCSLDETYDFIIKSFIENKIMIKKIINDEFMELIIKVNPNEKNENKETDIVINMKYDKNNKDFDFIDIYNKYIEVINKNNELKNKVNQLEKEIDLIKSLYTDNQNPKSIKILTDVTRDSYSDDISDNTFEVFKTIQNSFYLIYSNKNKSIICFNLIDKKKLIEIKNAHNDYITNFRYYLDKKKKRDLILSISCDDRNIKLWDVNNWECLLNISNIYNNGFIYSSCFINDNNNNNNYILTSNYNLYGDSEQIKVYDFNGQKIKEIEGSNECTSFIDAYYDIKKSKNYIITGNTNYVKSYDFYKNETFRKYSDNYNNTHLSIIINDNNEETKLIESCYDGNIRIWNFYSGLLLNKIKIGDSWLYGICLWNNNYLFVGCSDKSIKLIDLSELFIVKNFKGPTNSILTIKKIVHPEYGECLITQGYNEDQIKIWINNRN